MSEIVLVGFFTVDSAAFVVVRVVLGDLESLIVGFADDEVVVSFSDSGSDLHVKISFSN